MKSMLRAFAALGALACAAMAHGAAFEPQASIPGPDGRWDFTSWDGEHQKVLVAHGQDVLVFDPSTPNSVRAIGRVQHAHAAMAIPGTDTILVSSGGDDSLRILDLASGNELKRIAVAADPDAVTLSPDGGTAYVMGAKGGAISVVDLAKGVETGRIALQPGLELPVLFGGHLIAVNNEDRNEVELADLATGKAAGAIALTGCEGPTGMAIDPASGLALSACANGKAALVDLAHRKVVQTIAIGQGPDTVIWQAAQNRFLVPCGKSGTLSVIALEHGRARAMPVIATGTGARTAALDPASGRLFLPAARFSPAPKGKPAPVPGSFRLLILAPRG